MSVLGALYRSISTRPPVNWMRMWMTMCVSMWMKCAYKFLGIVFVPWMRNIIEPLHLPVSQRTFSGINWIIGEEPVGLPALYLIYLPLPEVSIKRSLNSHARKRTYKVTQWVQLKSQQKCCWKRNHRLIKEFWTIKEYLWGLRKCNDIHELVNQIALCSTAPRFVFHCIVHLGAKSAQDNDKSVVKNEIMLFVSHKAKCNLF